MAAIREAGVQGGGNIKCVLAIEVIGIEEQRVNDSRSPSWLLSPPPPPSVIGLRDARARSFQELFRAR